MRDIILLTCQGCKRRNYSTTKNKKNTPDKLELKKYCSHTYSRFAAFAIVAS